jgi:hypothetical protein
VFWSDLILLFIEGYMEFLISGLLTLHAPDDSVDKLPYMVALAYLSLAIAVIAIPGLYLWIFSKSLDEIKGANFIRTWGTLQAGVSLKKKANLFYSFNFVLRRLLYIFVAFYMKHLSAI